jgi:trehalose 6-phosphate synthase/phosphatase
MSRLLIVANRLPVTVRSTADGVEVERSTGGLATGLSRPHEQSGGLWIGWSGAGEDLAPEQQAELERQLAAQRLVGVPLTRALVTRYYEGYSNGVLWPLFHYLLEQVPLQASDWDAYVQANEQFAQVVAAQYRPGDLIWIHDYQLLLLPGMLRRRLPDARIGFFLHIPFPSEELFRTLPARGQLLEGMLGADLVGFHTPTYLRHFAIALTDILGLTVDIDRVQLPGREVRLGVFPMGVDAALFQGLASTPAVEAEAEALRGDGSVRILVGVDRLDYTKGIPRRLLAFERMLETHPELREKVRLVQVAVPSRTGVEAYQDFRALVDGLVGRINGVFGTPRWVPVHYIFRGLSAEDLVALYRAADVMLVTPLREPGGQGVRGFPHRRRRRAGAERVRRRRVGAARGAAGEPLRHRRHRRGHLPRPGHGSGGAPGAARAAARAGGDLRRAPLGVVLPRAARAGNGPRGQGAIAHRR